MINLLTSDDDLRGQRIAYMTKTIDAAAALGCPTIVTFTGSGHGMHFYGLPVWATAIPPIEWRTTWRAIPRSMVPSRNTLKRRESASPSSETTAGRGGGEGNIAHNPELWDAMFEAVPSKALGLSFDPSHLLWLGIDDIPVSSRNSATASITSMARTPISCASG